MLQNLSFRVFRPYFVYFIIDPDFQGGLITACRDDTIHLWNFRQKTPEIVHSVQLQKES